MVVETLPTCTSVLSLKARDVPRDQARFSGVFSICSWSIRKGESKLAGSGEGNSAQSFSFLGPHVRLRRDGVLCAKIWTNSCITRTNRDR
jgi:hypothetical protein